MIYEWRVYEIVLGKRKAMNERFAKHTLGLFKKHGMLKVEWDGTWLTLVGNCCRVPTMLALLH